LARARAPGGFGRSGRNAGTFRVRVGRRWRVSPGRRARLLMMLSGSTRSAGSGGGRNIWFIGPGSTGRPNIITGKSLLPHLGGGNGCRGQFADGPRAGRADRSISGRQPWSDLVKPCPRSRRTERDPLSRVEGGLGPFTLDGSGAAEKVIRGAELRSIPRIAARCRWSVLPA